MGSVGASKDGKQHHGVKQTSLELFPDPLFCVTPLRLWCMASSRAHQRRATFVGVWTSRHKGRVIPSQLNSQISVFIHSSSPLSSSFFHFELDLYLDGWSRDLLHSILQRCLGLRAWLGSQKISKDLKSVSLSLSTSFNIFQLTMEVQKSR